MYNTNNNNNTSFVNVEILARFDLYKFNNLA